MQTATGPTAPPSAEAPPRPVPWRTRRARDQRAGGARLRLARPDRHHVGLICLLAVTFLLRVWGIRQGLPYSYNSDEATHFVPRAIAFFGHDLNPHYFLNPPAYSYLLHVVFELWFGSADAVRRTEAVDPTAVFVCARLVAAGLGTLAVWLTYLAGARLFDRTVALLGAAVFGLAFLPIFYSHLALNDVPTLAPVALSLYGTAGILRNGARREYALAGIGAGLAAATKYTGGFTVVCLLAAALLDGLSGAPLTVARRLALGLLAAVVAFVLANPYSVLDFSAFHAGLTTQQALAAGSDPEKLGTTAASGTAYYLWTLTWGIGWVPTLAAPAGALLLIVRRRLGPALVLVPAPVAYLLFMGDQQRYFGRWLMPIFPIVALLGAFAVVALARGLVARRGMPPRLAAGAVGLLMLAQSLSTVIHNDLVLSRPDTRNLTRAWMVAHVPAGAKVVIEPVVAGDWAQDVGRSLSVTPSGQRWQTWNTYVTDVDAAGRHLPPGEHRFVAIDQYERTLRPELLDEYAASGYCWVVIGSLQAGRSFAQPHIAPQAIAYYAQLADRSRLEYHVSPFGAGDRAVPFSFDWSTDYEPPEYVRPGPEMSVYRLTEGRCASPTADAGAGAARRAPRRGPRQGGNYPHRL